MRARYTQSIGLSVFDEETSDVLGVLSGMVLNPDTGAAEGFFVRVGGFWSQVERLFLCCHDILHWGVRITVRHRDVLSTVDELVRVQEILTERRPILGQAIVTESGCVLGRCADVQFMTESFRLEWIFPRRFLRWGVPISASNILEVKTEAVIVRDPAVAEAEGEAVLIPPVPEAA